MMNLKSFNWHVYFSKASQLDGLHVNPDDRVVSTLQLHSRCIKVHSRKAIMANTILQTIVCWCRYPDSRDATNPGACVSKLTVYKGGMMGVYQWNVYEGLGEEGCAILITEAPFHQEILVCTL